MFIHVDSCSFLDWFKEFVPITVQFFTRSCFDWAYEEFQSTMYEADAEIAGAAVAQVGQVGA